MLDDLVGVIETLKARIQNHGPDLQANEIRTRMALIDPLLQALGWDTADPSLVTPEYNVSGRWADYALLSGSKPAAIIEAKKLDESLESHRMQMLNYSNASGIQYAGLTDGNRWELYEVFKQAPLEERRILDVSIASNPAHQAALQLLLLWRPNVSSDQPMRASEPILIAPTQPLPISVVPGSPPSQPTPEPASHPAPSAVGPEWVPLSKFARPGFGTKAPPYIRFPDGAQHKNKFWVDLLANTVKWLCDRGLLTTHNVPVASSGKRYIVNATPKHPGGNDFNAPHQVAGTELFVERNLNARAVVANAKRVLAHCNQDPSQVYLQLDN